jgi:hypothetical protein
MMAFSSHAEPFRADQWEHPKPGWIALIILGFLISWPVGLVIFAVLFMTGRLNGWKRAGLDLWQEGIRPMRNPGTWWRPRSSGNNFFDEYRSETLRRLEEEEKEFHEFLNRLRAAKDKSEFDQFMADRRNQSATTHPSPLS